MDRVLRYEDLAMNPNATTYDLLKFLGVSPTPAVDEFLQSHTTVQMGGVSSTFRVSRDVPFRWRNMLDFNYVDKIQVSYLHGVIFLNAFQQLYYYII